MLGQIGNTVINPPNFNLGYNPDELASNILPYHEREQNKQMQFQKDLMNLQSQIRMRELGQQIHMQQAAQPQNKPMDVIYKDYIDPYKQAQLALAGRRISATEENNQAKNEIAAQRAGTYQQLADNPNLAPVKTRGGDVVYIDKRTGQIVNTGISSGTLSQGEEIQQRGEQARQTEGTKEEGRESLEGVKQENRATNLQTRGEQALANIGARGKEQRETKQTPSADAGTNSKLPSQQKIASQMNMNKLINQHPELKPFMRINPDTGMVEISDPSSGGIMGSAPTQAQHEFMLKMIYPEGTTQNINPMPSNIPQDALVQRNKTTGALRYSTDGGKTWTNVGGR
jgi:hypothetical protein